MKRFTPFLVKHYDLYRMKSLEGRWFVAQELFEDWILVLFASGKRNLAQEQFRRRQEDGFKKLIIGRNDKPSTGTTILLNW